jgi:peptide chain release factor 1
MSKLPLNSIIDQYQKLNEQMSQTNETSELIKLGKTQKTLEKKYQIAIKIQKLEKINTESLEALNGENEGELYDLLKEEIENNKQEITSLEEELLVMLTPLDEKDEFNILLEIRAGAGGDESSLFAGEMVKTYSLMSTKLGFSFTLLEVSPGTMGGFDKVVIEIKGENVWSLFKYEGGVHRVQRVPQTEKQGRVHTSTISVAVMPLVENNSQFELDLSEVEIIASTSQGAGGQSVNTTYSAIQVHHKPTGMRAQCQDERNQQQNKIKALQILTTRVFDFYEEQRLAKEISERNSQVGRMDRSEKVRTYNFPQDRLTDHRFGQNWNQLPVIMSGGIQKVIEDIKRLVAQKNLEEINS